MCTEYGIPHVSTSQIIRSSIKSGSQWAEQAEDHMKRFVKIPDDVLIPLVVEYLSLPEQQQTGWLLDGFPRSRHQAEKLNTGM